MSEPGPTPLEQALPALLARVSPCCDSEVLALAAARGRVLAEAVRAPLDLPPFSDSAMDGYAVHGADAGRRLPVTQRIPAGSAGVPLPRGEAARIFTGAPVPAGADAVVPQEVCETTDGGTRVLLPEAINPGQHIRPAGQDTRAGDLLLEAGCLLRPQHLALLAASGVDRVTVHRPLRVALLASGNELREPGTGPLGPGEIFNSNRFMLAALLEDAGFAASPGATVADTAEATRAALGTAAAANDVILSTGGVSVGEEDHLRAAVEALGELQLWRIAMKPGKPLAFGHVAGTPFIGLPGNPSSAFVTFLVVALPVLRKLQGAGGITPRGFTVRAGFAVARPGKRLEFLRVRLEARGGEQTAVLAGNQSSGVISSLCRATALAAIPAGATVAAGDPVEVLPLAGLLP